MTESEALSKIEWAAKSIPSPSAGWLESILIQLQYCTDLLQGKVGSDRVEEIDMGYIAVREFDGYEKGTKECELTEAIREIDNYIKSRFLAMLRKSVMVSISANSAPQFAPPNPVTHNLALNLAPFGRWTLRGKAAQHRLALR